MEDTKERILTTALRLFARDGYAGVSVRMIAEELHITKGAIYKHYKNKRDIFECIVERMNTTDYDRAVAYEMPEDTLDAVPQSYEELSLEQVAAYSKAQFRYWTCDAFASDFRKLLTLEQYRNPEMAQLYQQYLANGPLMYMADIFGRMLIDEQDAMGMALAFYGPFFLYYSIYDGAEEKEAVLSSVDQYIDDFVAGLRPKTRTTQ